MMDKERLEELINRKPSKWGNLTIPEFERDIRILQEQAKRVEKLENHSYNAHLEILRREQQIERYREALEFYAGRNHYSDKLYDNKIVLLDDGETARKVLEG